MALAHRYVTLSELGIISAISFLFLIFLILMKNARTKKMKLLVFSSVFFLVMLGGVLLSISYMIGWERGQIMYNERALYLECVLDRNFDVKTCPYYLHENEPKWVEKFAPVIEKLKLGPFAERGFNINPSP